MLASLHNAQRKFCLLGSWLACEDANYVDFFLPKTVKTVKTVKKCIIIDFYSIPAFFYSFYTFCKITESRKNCKKMHNHCFLQHSSIFLQFLQFLQFSGDRFCLLGSWLACEDANYVDFFLPKTVKTVKTVKKCIIIDFYSIPAFFYSFYSSL